MDEMGLRRCMNICTVDIWIYLDYIYLVSSWLPLYSHLKRILCLKLYANFVYPRDSGAQVLSPW